MRMTVGTLIQELKKYPEHLKVIVLDSDGDHTPLDYIVDMRVFNSQEIVLHGEVDDG